MKFSRNKLVLGMALLGLTSMVSVNVYAAPPSSAPSVTTTITPTPGKATIDGNISEWNTSADFSVKMCTAGSVGADGNCTGSGKVNLSTMYSRYDCNANTMYVLVLETAGNAALLLPNDAWVTIGGQSNKVVKGDSGANGTPPDFQWVTIGGDLKGYEASFPLNAGTHNTVEVHLQVIEGATGNANTSSTGKISATSKIIVPENCTVPAIVDNSAAEAAAKAAAEAAAAKAAAEAAAAEAAAKAAAEAAAAEAAAKAAAEAAAAKAAEEAAAAKAAEEAAAAAAKKQAEDAAAAKAAKDAADAEAKKQAEEAAAAKKAADEAAAAEKAAKEAEAKKQADEAAAAEKAAKEAADKAAKEAADKEAADKAAKDAAEKAAKEAADKEAADKAAKEAAAAEEAAKAAAEAAAAKAAEEAEAAAKAAAEAEAAAKAAEEEVTTTETENDNTGTTPATCASATDANAPRTTTVYWDDSKGTNAYGIQLVGVEGNTWTYQVDKTSGKDLSHWVLGFGSCADHVTDTSSSDGSMAEIGKDGSIKDRDFSGIKWNSEGGTFSFTLDGDYAANALEVLAKAGSLNDGGYSTSMVMGPDCSCTGGPEVVLTGSLDTGDICSYFKTGNAANAGDVAIPGAVHASNKDGSDASGVAVTISSGNDDTSVICAGGEMSGSCDFVTDAGGNINFEMVASWPGIVIPAEVKDQVKEMVKAGKVAGTPKTVLETAVADYLRSTGLSQGGDYTVSAEGGGDAINLGKSLGWNSAMVSSADMMNGRFDVIGMSDGCTLTLSDGGRKDKTRENKP